MDVPWFTAVLCSDKSITKVKMHLIHPACEHGNAAHHTLGVVFPVLPMARGSCASLPLSSSYHKRVFYCLLLALENITIQYAVSVDCMSFSYYHKIEKFKSNCLSLSLCCYLVAAGQFFSIITLFTPAHVAHVHGWPGCLALHSWEVSIRVIWGDSGGEYFFVKL